MIESLLILTWILMQEMLGWAFVYTLDMSLVVYIAKFTLVTKKSLKRKVLPVRDAVLGGQLLCRPILKEQLTMKL